MLAKHDALKMLKDEFLENVNLEDIVLGGGNKPKLISSPDKPPLASSQ